MWTTTPAVNLVTTSGSELLPNPSFTSNASNWTFAKAGTAQATGANDHQRSMGHLAGRLQGELHDKRRQREHRHHVAHVVRKHRQRSVLPADVSGGMHFGIHPGGNRPEKEHVALHLVRKLDFSQPGNRGGWDLSHLHRALQSQRHGLGRQTDVLSGGRHPHQLHLLSRHVEFQELRRRPARNGYRIGISATSSSTTANLAASSAGF